MSPFRFGILLTFLVGLVSDSPAQDLPDGFTDQLVSSLDGFAPADLEFLPDGRILIAAQKSKDVRLFRFGFGGSALVDTVAGVSLMGPEEGLAGIAVDPRWPTLPYLYTHFTAVDSTIRVRRYKAVGALSDPAGLFTLSDPYEVLVVPNNHPHHNGGTLKFASDSTLFVSLGEDIDRCTAQDSTTLKGVILRLKVMGLPDGPGGPPSREELVPVGNPFVGTGGDEELVFCYGLRNPFRFTIHPVSGNLLIGDVGQVSYEEIDEAQGGENFGWPHREGFSVQEYLPCPEPGGAGTQVYDSPLYDYPNAGGAAVVAGVVYQQQGGEFDYPSEYNGAFFFSDFVKGWVRVLEETESGWAVMDSVPGQPNAEDWAEIPAYVSDWDVGGDGALYYLLQYVTIYGGSTGELRRIVYVQGNIGVPEEPPFPLVSVWPNPVRRGEALRGESWGGGTGIQVFDVRGGLVQTLPITQGQFRWDGRDSKGFLVAPGVYWIRPTPDGTGATRKIIIRP